MTTKQADKIIVAVQPVTFYNTVTRESFTGTPVSRDRYNIIIMVGGRDGVFDRSELSIIK